MRKVVLVSILIASVAFSYNTLLGNRGTFGVYSGACEDMGMLTINLNAFGTMVNIDSLVPPDTLLRTDELTEILPYVALSFTPWHYLEFSLWNRGRYATFGPYSSAADELYDNLGLSVKGGAPIYFNEKRRSYFAPGIDGFAYMQGLGTNVFGFGGRGLLTLRLNWFGMHLNGGYEYITIPTGPQGNLLTGVGLEVWPFKWGGIIVDGVATIPQNDFGNFANYLKVIPGLRFGFGGRVVKFNVNLGAQLEPMQTPFRWHALAGFGLGFDLMPTPIGFVKGIVVDRGTQNPIAEANIYIEGHSDIDSYITATDGRFTVDHPEGDYYLVAEHPDYVTARVSSELIMLEDGTIMLELTPAGGATVVGTVIAADDNSSIEAVINFVSMTGDEVLDSFKSDPVSGYFRAVVPAGTYRVDVTAVGYKKTHKSMLLEDGDEVVVDFKLVRTEPEPEEIPPPITFFRSVYFGRGESGLSPQDYTPLNEAVEVLKGNPEVKIQLSGYTDSVGDASGNYNLSVRRANAVRSYLTSRGIAPDRIYVVGFGESNPRGDNRTNSGRAMNRRVDIVVL
jgi:outer membrane protein OmpA-like peptidoglycan-associated protein